MRHLPWMTVPLLALACGGSTGDDLSAASSVTVEQACTDELTAYCKKLTQCAPLFNPLIFGDEATCIARNQPSCVKGMALPGSPTTAVVETCVTDLNADMDCPKLLAHDPPASCQPKGGSVANGAVCGNDWQCQSGYCQTPDDMQCGVCADRGGPEAACKKDDDCSYGLVCSSMVCAKPGAAGEACDKNHPCRGGLVCAGATFLMPIGTCAAAAPAGGDCSMSGCSLADGLYCNKNKLCQKIAIAKPGEPCGTIDETLTVCSGSECKVTADQMTGLCGAIAEDGAACDATNGPKCKLGAKCIGGVCQLTDPSSCK